MAKIVLKCVGGLVLSVGAGKGRPKTYENVIREAKEGYAKIELEGVSDSFYAPIAQAAEKVQPKIFRKDYEGNVSFVKVKGAGKPPKDAVKIEADRMETVDGVETNLKNHWLITERKVSAEEAAAAIKAKETAAKQKKAEAARKFLAELAAEEAAAQQPVAA